MKVDEEKKKKKYHSEKFFFNRFVYNEVLLLKARVNKIIYIVSQNTQKKMISWSA